MSRITVTLINYSDASDQLSIVSCTIITTVTDNYIDSYIYYLIVLHCNIDYKNALIVCRTVAWSLF